MKSVDLEVTTDCLQVLEKMMYRVVSMNVERDDVYQEWKTLMEHSLELHKAISRTFKNDVEKYRRMKDDTKKPKNSGAGKLNGVDESRKIFNSKLREDDKEKETSSKEAKRADSVGKALLSGLSV